MKKIYELLPDIFGDYTATITQNLPEIVNFRGGRIIQEGLPTPLKFLTGHSSNNPPKSMLGYSIPIMSKSLISVFLSSGVSNLQCFPAELVSEVDNTIWTDYFAVNIIGLISCANLEKSDYIHIIDRPGENSFPLLAFNDLKVNPDCLDGTLLFRLAESPGVILIDSNLVDKLFSLKSEEEWGITVVER